MIKSVELENYRCFSRINVELKPFNVLIGPNDSGKSAFMTAIHAIGNQSKLQDYDIFRREKDKISVIKITNSDGSVYSLSSHSDRNLLNRTGEISETFIPVSYFQLPSNGIQMFCQGDPDQLGVPTLNGDGRNLASILDIFLRRDRERFFRVRDILIKQVPGVEDINILTPAPDKRNINFTIDNGFEIDGNKTSVGVRLILFFIVLSNHPRPPKTILIEEPENGVHPGRLIEIIHMLRTLSEGKYGNCPTQIILSTHSPYLLDAVDLDQDQVLVFERGEQGDRHVKPVDKQKLKVFLDEFLLGEVWYNEGEKGLV